MLETQTFPASKVVPRRGSCGEAQGRLLFPCSCSLGVCGQASEHAPGDAACQAHTRKSKLLTNLATEGTVNTFRLRQFITYRDGERKTSQTSQLACPHTPTRIALKLKEPDASSTTWTGRCWGASCRQQLRDFSLQLYSEGLGQKAPSLIRSYKAMKCPDSLPWGRQGGDWEMSSSWKAPHLLIWWEGHEIFCQD